MNRERSSRALVWRAHRTPLILAVLVTLALPRMAAAGVCAGGIDAGKFCNFSSDCRKTCAGGIDAGHACIFDSDCRKTCAGGIDAGHACIFNSDCRKTCAGGPNGGRACIFNSDCPGSACLSTSCLGTSCLGTTCLGGLAAATGVKAPVAGEEAGSAFAAWLDQQGEGTCAD